jgi:hypothetical protein
MREKPTNTPINKKENDEDDEEKEENEDEEYDEAEDEEAQLFILTRVDFLLIALLNIHQNKKHSRVKPQ